MAKKVLRPREVTKKVNLSRTTIWRREREGNFPRRIRLGPNSTGWLEEEIDAWLDSRPRGLALAGENQEQVV